MKVWRPTGGQSIPAFDYYMAPGVAKSFCKEFKKVLDIKYPECDHGEAEQLESGNLTNQGIYKALKQYRNEHRLIMNEEGYEFIRELMLSKYCKTLDYSEVSSVFKQVERLVEDATHQAMEAVIHNLNSMHCLPYSERLWVYDIHNKKFDCMQIGELTERFETNRFMAVSLNKSTGEAEFKYITAAKRMNNHRKLIKLTSNQGASVTVTDNHKIMSISGKDITEGYPKDVTYVISPRGIKTPCASNDICLEGYGRVRKDSPYLENHVVITEDFAELMGYYVADGSLLGDTGTICFTTCGKVPFKEMSELVYRVFGKEFSTFTTTFEHSKFGESEKDIRFGVGRRLTRMIADKFGKGSRGKRIPTEILFATGNIKEAFLRAYFRCDGRSQSKYGEASSVNIDLVKQLGFMLLSLKASPHFYVRDMPESGFNTRCKLLGTISISAEDAVRAGIRNSTNTAFSIPKYDLSMVPNILSDRASGNTRYSELEEMLAMGINKGYKKFTNFFVNSIINKEEIDSGEEYVYDISVADNENFMTADGIYVHNSRAGAQVV